MAPTLTASSTEVLAGLEALELVQLSDAERRGFDPAQPFVDWGPLETIISRLRSRYASLLDIRVSGIIFCGMSSTSPVLLRGPISNPIASISASLFGN
jgi:hypothetical protein